MRALHALSLLIGLLLCGAAGAAGTERQVITDPALREREARLLDEAVQALVPGRPGVPDLYVVGFGGDSTEDVFRNEIAHLDTLMTERFGARGRVLTLVNHSDSLIRTPRPLANLDNLRTALRGVASKMDDEDVLLLFMTMHGTPEHQLVALMPPAFVDMIAPRELRDALDDAGIRHRVLAISACFSGGFVPALQGPRTVVIAAAHRNRPSFGCGPDSDATFFGRAWLIDALNETTDFVEAFEIAKRNIAVREKAEDFRPSKPQIAIGKEIVPVLQAWQAQLQPGPKVAYAFNAPPVDSATAPAEAASVENPREKR
jgi:hypothetical protein